jgi:hypothetical protein
VCWGLECATESVDVVLKDRWTNRTGLATKTLDDLRVIIRRERPGEMERAELRRELRDRLWQRQNMLAKEERTGRQREVRERAAANLWGDVLAFKNKKRQSGRTEEKDKEEKRKAELAEKIATLRAEIEELTKSLALLEEDEEWRLDNAQDVPVDNAKVVVVTQPLVGYSVEYVIEKRENENENEQYVMIIKLDGEHVTNSPSRIYATSVSSQSPGPPSPSFASPFSFSPPSPFEPKNASGSSSGLLDGITATSSTNPRRRGGRKSRTAAPAIDPFSMDEPRSTPPTSHLTAPAFTFENPAPHKEDKEAEDQKEAEAEELGLAGFSFAPAPPALPSPFTSFLPSAPASPSSASSALPFTFGSARSPDSVSVPFDGYLDEDNDEVTEFDA